MRIRFGERDRIGSSLIEQLADGLPEAHLNSVLSEVEVRKRKKELVLVLIMKEERTKMTMACVVPNKGSFRASAAKGVLCFSRGNLNG